MALATQQQADALECPRCKQIDQVQRVSSIVESGTSTSLHKGRGLIGGYAFFGHHSGGPVVGVSRTTTKGVQQTHLAGKLALRGAPRAGSTGGAVVSAATVMGITGVLLAGLGVLILGAMGPGLGSVLGLGLFLAMGLGLIWAAVRHKEQRAWPHDNPVMDRWRWARATWPHLFFCYRCGGIYLPGLPTLYPLGAGIGYLQRVVADAREAGLFGPA